MPEVVDLAGTLAAFADLWSPKVVARMNDYEVKVVKVQGEFEWHTHADTDELFLVIAGRLTIQLRDGDVTLGPGQLFVVPRGVEHCPLADVETQALLIEPVGVVNTGDAGGPLTATYDDSLADHVGSPSPREHGKRRRQSPQSWGTRPMTSLLDSNRRPVYRRRMTRDLDSGGESPTEVRRQHIFRTQAWVGAGCFLLANFALDRWGDLSGTSPWRFVWALLPLLPLAWIVAVTAHRVRQMDEYQLKLMFPGLAVGFAVAVFAAITVALLGARGSTCRAPDGSWLCADCWPGR